MDPARVWERCACGVFSIVPTFGAGSGPHSSIIRVSHCSFDSASAGQSHQEVEGPEPVLRHWSIGVGSVGAMPSILQIVLQLSNYVHDGLWITLGFGLGLRFIDTQGYAAGSDQIMKFQTCFVSPHCARVFDGCMRSSGI